MPKRKIEINMLWQIRIALYQFRDVFRTLTKICVGDLPRK